MRVNGDSPYNACCRLLAMRATKRPDSAGHFTEETDGVENARSRNHGARVRLPCANSWAADRSWRNRIVPIMVAIGYSRVLLLFVVAVPVLGSRLALGVLLEDIRNTVGECNGLSGSLVRFAGAI
jgi:hypothetical protein